MDGYLSKPLQIQRLQEAIEASVAGTAREAPPMSVPLPPHVAPPSAAGVWKPAEALARVAGNETVFAEIVHAFLQDLPTLLQELQSAVAAGDAERASRAAHRLRGSASFFEAEPLTKAAQRLEATARTGDLSGADGARREIEDEARRLAEALTIVQGRKR